MDGLSKDPLDLFETPVPIGGNDMPGRRGLGFRELHRRDLFPERVDLRPEAVALLGDRAQLPDHLLDAILKNCKIRFHLLPNAVSGPQPDSELLCEGTDELRAVSLDLGVGEALVERL